MNVSLSPRHDPRDISELGVIIAVLDSMDFTEGRPTGYLSEVGDLIRPRLDALNEVFSESQYPDFKRKLSIEKEPAFAL